MLPLMRLLIISWMCICLCASTPAWTQPNPAPSQDRLVAETSNAINARYERASVGYYEDYYRHLAELNEIQRSKFKWQDRASEVTLWLVVFVVVSGVSLSAFQLWLAFAKSSGVAGGGEITDTTIELSKQSFRVTSSIVGIIILLISVGFLFLFLREVYTIKIVSSVQPSDRVATGVSRRQMMRTAQAYGLPAPSPIPPATAKVIGKLSTASSAGRASDHPRADAAPAATPKL